MYCFWFKSCFRYFISWYKPYCTKSTIIRYFCIKGRKIV